MVVEKGDVLALADDLGGLATAKQLFCQTDKYH